MDNHFPKFELKSQLRMPGEQVVSLYQTLEQNGAPFWVDGGWGVDALLGKQTREHADLDIAIDHDNEAKMKEVLSGLGYKVTQTNDKTEWNYVMSDGQHEIDVHVFGFNESGRNVYGTKYPKDSLSGTGTINGAEVRCISAKWMVQFKSHPNQSEVDRFDQQQLCEKYSLTTPPLYQL